MLHIPRFGCQRSEENIGASSSEFGTAVPSNGSAHSKNTTYTTLIASTARDAFGIFILLVGNGTAGTRINFLCDIAIGAASSETVIIPNLIGGASSATNSSNTFGHAYFFPIKIPAGTRVSATNQTNQASVVNLNVAVHLLNTPMFPGWWGSRVTAYGVDTGASTGTSISPGNNSYTTGTIIASSTNPVKYLQLGMDILTSNSGSNLRGLIEILADSQVLVDDLQYNESTTFETVNFAMVNMVLSKMRFNIPAAKNLTVGAMRNAAAAARGFALYGVD